MMRLLRCLLAGLALCLCIAPACARDRITVALQLEPNTLDPTSGAAAAVKEVTYRIFYEGLTTLDTTGAPVPLLATSWTMAPDAKSYIFHLRPGVRFSDGTAFDARIVAFSLTRAIKPDSTNSMAERLREISGVDVIDPLTVRVRLSQPDAGLPTLLAWGDCVMVAPGSADHLATEPIGTGPFLYKNWKRGDRLILVRNEAYWGTKPALRTIEYRFISDPAAAYAAMKTHSIDVFPDYPAPENLAQLRADPSLRVTTAPSEGEVILALNNRVGPLADVRVRRAISYALDRRAIIDGAMFGYGQPIGSHFPPQNPDYVDLTGLYPHDPAKARALLAEAGYPHGFALTLKLPPPSYARRSGEVIAAQLASVGIHATIVPVEWPQWLDEVYARHAFDMTIVNHAEPADYDIYGRTDYYFGYDGRAVKALLDRLRATTNPGERHAILGDIQRRIAEDAANSFLFQFAHLSVADAGLTHLWANTPLQAIDFTSARFAGVDAGEEGRRHTHAWGVPLLLLVAFAGVVGLARAAGVGWVLRRLGILALTLAGASVVIFGLLQLAPGDPAQFMMGLQASPEAVAALRAELGLGGPAVARYFHWIADMARGDLGTSYAYRVPVSGLIGSRLAVSLPLACLAMLVSVLIGLPAAFLAARRPKGWLDRTIGAVTRLGVAVPGFWLAMILLLVFAVHLRWFPANGFPGWQAGIGPALAALILPIFALALPQAALIARVARVALLAEQSRDYVRTARAKGLGRSRILWRHIAPNAAAPILAIVGLQFPFLLAGSVIVENVFYLPGLGSLVVQAITARDLIVVQAVAMLMVAATVIASFLTDVAQALLDPEIAGAGMKIGPILLGLIVAMALLSMVWTPWDVGAIDVVHRLQSASATHWLGTDQLGRDLISLLMAGARPSLGVAALALLIGLAGGVPLGLLAAARPGWVDELVARGTDILFAFPAILLALLVIALLGPGASHAALAIGLFNIPVFARVTRASARGIWARDFILAARLAGKGRARISLEHVLPNIAGPLITQASLQLSLGVLAEAALSFLGLGAQPPAASWGRMVADAQTLIGIAPSLVLLPGLMIVVTVVAINLTGEVLRDRFVPETGL